MLMDIIIGLIVLINVISGYRRGLLNMLGHLILVVLSLLLTLVLLSPLVSWLVQRPFLEPMEQRISAPILEPLQEATQNWGEALSDLDLPPSLQSLLAQQVPADDAPFAQAYPAFSASLFRFALTAALFVFIFALFAIGIRLITRSLTRISDRVILLGWVNRLAGLAVGLGFAVVQVLLLFLILTYLSWHVTWAREMIAGSYLFDWLYSTEWFVRFF